MKSFLISDNKDTWVGMKLAGVDGVILHSHDEILNAIKSAVKNDEIGILILTEKIADQVREEVMKFKIECKKLLIIEIPDRHGTLHSQDRITNYIRESVGIQI